MEHVADIPVPQPGDSETVVSMLETAAVFSAKGDAAEALSWLKRAAESAGDSGDDSRTLALARSVSNLSDRLRAPASLLGEAAPLGTASLTPKPPHPVVVPAAAASDDDDAVEATPILLSVRADKPPVSVRPPPPSSRAAPPSTTPSPSSVRVATLLASVTATTPVSTTPTATATPVSPPASKRPAKPSAALGSAANASPAPASAANASPAPSKEPWRGRDAARVSVVKSSTEPGLYYVRLLEDGKRPHEGFEGLLVALDPDSTLRP
jgi:hypothetical protein